MTVEIRVPALGESLNVATVARWLKKPADYVRSGETLLELETDKVSLDVPSPVSGQLGEVVPEGTEVVVDQVLAVLDETVPAPEEVVKKAEERKTVQEEQEVVLPPERTSFLSEPALAAFAAGEDGIRREKMSRLRQTIARNLKDAQNTAAILTTFNEIDMSAVRELRATYREAFEKKHDGVRLGFMSFFARAVVEALKDFPALNAQIEGDEILYRDHVNLGIAVGTERGLVVPVLHRADEMSFAELERCVADYGKRARAGRVLLSELAGGSFTITNGGIFGSLLSTPILNVRQSGVLGIHAIQERPVARNGQVVIRPMMYVALSYDHRLVDGREAVSFLVRVKELIEDPRRLLLGL